MPYRSFPITPDLAPAVSDLWVQESRLDARYHDFVPTRVLPTGSVTLAFYYREPFQAISSTRGSNLLPRANVSGPQTTFAEYAATGRTGIVLLRFRPGHASSYLDAPLSEFTDQEVDLATIIGQAPVATLLSRLDAASSMADRVRVVSAHVAARLLRNSPTPQTAALVDHVGRRARPPTVAELAELAGCSMRALQRRFRSHAGISPKRFLQVQRMHRALRRHDARRSWSRTAFDAGYHDQAHLIRDFRQLAGLAPVELVRRARHTRLGAHFNDFGADATAAVTYV